MGRVSCRHTGLEVSGTEGPQKKPSAGHLGNTLEAHFELGQRSTCEMNAFPSISTHEMSSSCSLATDQHTVLPSK